MAALCRQFSCRQVAISGGILVAVGLVSTGFASNIYITYITFGLTTGTKKSVTSVNIDIYALLDIHNSSPRRHVCVVNSFHTYPLIRL